MHRALRNERWRPRNIPSQKEVLLCLPVQVCCCLPPAFLPGIFCKTLAVRQPYREKKTNRCTKIYVRSHLHYLVSRCNSFFPLSFVSATPSLKYSQRGAKGEVVATFGSVQGTRWAGSSSGVQLELLEGPDHSLRTSYKYMFQRLRDIRNGKQACLLWN